MNSKTAPDQPTANSDQKDRHLPAPAPRQFLAASSLVGLTAGLFAGMSESPVATALIAGVFGLIGGGGIFGFLGGRAGKDEKGSANLHFSSGNMQRAATGTSLLCISCILGVFVGIGLREGLLIPQSNKSDNRELVAIEEVAKEFEPPVQLKLAILQSELDTLGIPPTQNNQFINDWIAANRHGSAKRNEDSTQWMTLAARDSIKSIEQALRAISEARGETEDDQDRTRRLKRHETLSYGNVKEAFECLKVAHSTARARENFVLHSTTPDLNQILDLVSKYRQSNLYEPGGKRAGQLVNPRRYFDSDPKNRLLVNP